MRKKKGKQSEIQMAATMAQYVQIQDVYLDGCSAQILESRTDLDDSEENVIDVETSVDTEVDYSIEDHTIWVTANCEALFIKDADKLLKKKKVLSIKCSFVLEYEYLVKGGPSEKELEKHLGAFASVSGTFNAWPYFREYVQTTTTRMGLTPYYIPMYRVDAEE